MVGAIAKVETERLDRVSIDCLVPWPVSFINFIVISFVRCLSKKSGLTLMHSRWDEMSDMSGQASGAKRCRVFEIQ